MRHLTFDEIRPADLERVREYVHANAIPGPLEGIYFVEFPEDTLSATQKAHVDCKPFCFAIELGDTWIRMELLVRSRKTLHCACIAYANRPQTDFVLGFGEELILACGIRT